jgi:VIT1/CCC1 family predicted Fe2+/Mn2+ transporter
VNTVARYAKAVAAVLGGIASVLTAYFGSAHWSAAVLAAVTGAEAAATALSVALVPNRSPAPPGGSQGH